MIKTLKFLMIFIACLALAACTNRWAPQQSGNLSNMTGLANNQQVEVLGSAVNAKAIVFIPTDEIFQPFSYQLRPGAKQKLSQVASLIRSLGAGQVIVMAYTDHTGDRAQRLQVAHDQAYTVATFLWAELIPLDHITIKAVGAKHPVASNRTVYGAKANRRIEILVR